MRAAALAESRFGAGRGCSSFLFVVVGTGASACLVVDGRTVPRSARVGDRPRRAAGREVASGRALARAAGLERAEDVLASGRHGALVDDAAAALAGVLAVLANALDPELIVLGGGLGSAARFRDRVDLAFRPLLAYPAVPELALVASAVPDGGIVGAALRAAESAG